MKTFLKTLGLAALLALALAPARVFAQDDITPVSPQNDTTPAQAPDQTQAPDQAQPPDQAQAPNNNSVSFQTFYDQLSTQGTWIQTNQYGYVWQPTESDPNWRPYTYGHWVNTAQGMMWASDEPFGWATYHYGRWVNLAGTGWVWVPGYTWAPAWVSWRDGDGDDDDYVGWAPLPPDTLLGIDFNDFGFFGFDFGWPYWGYWGFHIGDDCDLAYGIGPGCYNFCPVAYLGDPSPWRHFADRRDNFALINHTRNVTNLNVSNDPVAGQFGRVHSDGPGAAALARSRTPVANERLTSASSLAANGSRSGNSLAVYAPNVRTGSDSRPSHVGANLGNVTVNRGTNINQPLAVNSHLRGAAPTTAQIRAASLAAGNAPSDAKIARANTTFSRALSEPLASYRPGGTAGTNFRPATTVASSSVFHASSGAPSVTSHTFTSAPATHRASAPSQGSSFLGGFFSRFSSSGSSATHASVYHSTVAPAVPHRASTSSQGSSFLGGFFSRFNSGGSSSTHASVYHSSPAPEFHSSAAPTYHYSAPAYHSPAPAMHFGGGAPAMHFGGGAPAAHFSGGGGHPSGGGGHPSGGGQQHH